MAVRLGGYAGPAPQDLAHEAQAIVRHAWLNGRITFLRWSTGPSMDIGSRIDPCSTAGASWGPPGVVRPGVEGPPGLREAESTSPLKSSRGACPSSRGKVIPVQSEILITRISATTIRPKVRTTGAGTRVAFDLTTWPRPGSTPSCLRCAWDPGVPRYVYPILPLEWDRQHTALAASARRSEVVLARYEQT